jgi:hypothetical protein
MFANRSPTLADRSLHSAPGNGFQEAETGGAETMDGPNVRWSLDFVHDQLGDGRRVHILAVVDVTCEPVSDAREPVSAFCAGKRFPGGGDGRW